MSLLVIVIGGGDYIYRASYTFVREGYLYATVDDSDWKP